MQLRVLNTLGQEVAVLAQGLTAAGWHRLSWQRTALPGGLCYVQLTGPGFAQVARAMVL